MCLVTLAVNPKEYIEIFKDRNLNKNHEGITKGSPGLEHENYAERIKSLVNFDPFEKPQPDTKKVLRLTADKAEMIGKTVEIQNFCNLMIKGFTFQMGLIHYLLVILT